MDFCGKSTLPVGRESLPSVPNAPEPCGVGRIEGGPCRLSAPESWIFFQISSDVLPLPLEVVGFALPRRARPRGDDAFAEVVAAPPAAPPAARGLSISANCSTLKLLVGIRRVVAALPINWFTNSSFIESWPERPPATRLEWASCGRLLRDHERCAGSGNRAPSLCAAECCACEGNAEFALSRAAACVSHESF